MRLRLRRTGRTEGVSETCEWAFCKKPSAGELRGHLACHPLPWGMCAAHLKPAMHPDDLRGKLYWWPT